MLILPGDDGLTEYGWRYNKSNQPKRKRGNDETERENEDMLVAQIRKTFRIYFPPEETVVNSKGGPSVSSPDILWWAQLMATVWRNHLPSVEMVQRGDFSSKPDARLQEPTARLAYA